MSRIPVRLAACCLVVLLAGCAYFNGMYNVRRYARQAERSERRGRASEAADRWRQVIEHAETLLARHPRSRWADDALLLKGRALVRLEAYPEAAPALVAAVAAAPNEERRREAQLELGRAYLGLRRLDEAKIPLDSAVLSTAPAVRAQALLLRGRLLRATGRLVEALDDFAASGAPEARFEHARTTLAIGEGAAAAEEAAGLVWERPYREAEWLSLLDTLAAAGLEGPASALVDSLLLRPDIGSGARARLLLADARRLVASGLDSLGAARLGSVTRSAPDSAEGREAVVRLVRLDLRNARQPSDVADAQARLTRVAALGGEPSRLALETMRLIARGDSLAALAPLPDAGAFLRAEFMRDSLGAAALAAEAFVTAAERYPESPWAPKALLAAIVAGYPASDSLRAVLAARYASSPYVAVARGAADADEARFAELEDSLRAALEPLSGGTLPSLRRQAPAPGEEEDEPGLRRGRQQGGQGARPQQPARPAQRPAPQGPGPHPEP